MIGQAGREAADGIQYLADGSSQAGGSGGAPSGETCLWVGVSFKNASCGSWGLNWAFSEQ